MGLSLVALGWVCWKAPAFSAPSQFHRADSYAGWSWKAAKSLVPLFEWTEYLLPEQMSTPNVPGYVGQPLITPEIYFRANQNKFSRNTLRSFILVQLESVRFDVINESVNGKAVTPFLNSLAREGLFFTKAYANSAQTNYAALCAPLGLYPMRSRFPYIYKKEDTSPHYMLHDLLKPFGYRTLFFSSQYEQWAGMDTYWRSSSLDWYLDSTGYDISSDGGILNFLRNRKRFAGNTDDSVTIGKFLQFLKSESSDDRPFLAFLSLENGHFPYPLPNGYQRPFEPGVINFPASYLNFPREKIGVLKNAYWNVVSYMDSQLQRLYDGMVALGIAENTILVILADHGEELFDLGFPTHGTKLCDPVLHIPLVIYDKRQTARIVDTPVSQADIAPTILGMLGLDAFPGHQGLDVLNEPEESLVRRPIFFHTNGLGQQDGVLVWPWKLTVDSESGEGNLYNLEWGEVTAGEQRNHHPLKFETLKRCLRKFSEGQLAYYTYGDLHGKFFPPCPQCTDILGPDGYALDH
jgi:phosphoglycerol transferase MdoB-like AlkP superfamily enzyme